MGYLGNNLQVAYPTYRLIDDISGSFNGSTKTFALKVSGSAPVPPPLNSQQCLISVAGVIQQPDDTGVKGFKLSGSNIVFSSAPAGGASFFGIILAGADYVNVGANFPSGSAAVPSVTFDASTGTGVYLDSSNVLGFTTGGTKRATIDSNGNFIVVGSGSATAPALAAGSGTTYSPGIYSPGTDQIALATGGSGRLFIDSSGNVGIGATATEKFVVSGPIVAKGTLAASQTSAGVLDFSSDELRIRCYGATAGTGAFTVRTGGGGGSTDTERLRITSGGLVGIGTSSPTLQFEISNGTNTGYLHPGIGTGLSVGTKNASSLTLDTNNTARVTITSGGSVGIGTTSPSNRLSISSATADVGLYGTSNVYTNYLISAASIGYTGDANWLFGGSVSDFGIRGQSNIVFGIAANERARIDSSGRLLVGTSSAQGTSIVQVCGNSTASTDPGDLRIIRGLGVSSIGGNVGAGLGIIRFGSLEATVCATIEAQSDATWSSTSDTPGRLVFSVTRDGQASPLEAMRITNSGLMQFGTTNTPYGVHEFNWQGASRMAFNNKDATAGNCYGLVLNYTNAAPNGTGNEFIYCQDNAAARLLVRSNGGIANYSANNANLSDRNVKKDIAPAAGTWDCLKEWEIVNFRYKDQPDDADLNMGVIAQQVAESCPEVITVFQEAKEATDDQPAQEERIGVKEQQMMWMAIKALQEAQLRIETLEAEVAALKGA